MPNPKLDSNPVCPFAHRSRLALAIKEVDHELVYVDLKEMPQWYKDICPTASVPMIEHLGQRIWESAIINEYVEDAFSGPELLPRDPYLRARARLAIDSAGTLLIQPFYKALKGELENPKEQFAEMQHKLVETMAGDGPFWVGDKPGLADIAIYPWFERAIVLKHYHGLELNASPRLEAWQKAMAALPAVQKEAGDPQSFIEGYSKYAPAPAR
jgi:glutathione S-transferase